MADEITDGANIKDYTAAMNAVLDIAEVAISFVPGGTAASKAAKYAGKAAKVAIPLARKAIDNSDTLAPVVEKGSEQLSKAKDSLAGGARGVSDRAKEATEAVSKKARGALQKAADERSQKRAQQEARQAVLANAGTRMSSDDFLENWEAHVGFSGENGDNYLRYSGCYVVLRFARPPRKDEFGSFADVFVGKSDNMGASIHDDFLGRGNRDVYADVKYKQCMQVLLYPCKTDGLETVYQSLITVLDADESYNGRT